MRYVSTRGQAPQLDFVEVMLAGLARDGGLYVPVSWPQLSPETIAAFAGKPYAEVAVEVIKPFVGGTIAEASFPTNSGSRRWSSPLATANSPRAASARALKFADMPRMRSFVLNMNRGSRRCASTATC